MIFDTIVAPATPYGIGGISVVRISGRRSQSISNKLINNNGLSAVLKPRIASLVYVYDEDGIELDEAILTFFKSPASYTGEDLVEISCHGNPVIVDNIIAACCHYGARIAQPGEFTKRAYVNGKMDLVQAEAVASLISARSNASQRLNLRLLQGKLSEKLNELRKQLIDIASMVEFELDISEDALQPNINEKIKSISTDQIANIQNLLGSFAQARLLNRGALVVIAGKPNVGKSTLLNTLTETDRAITSAYPGTTRDIIDAPLIIDGVPINLIDTAGIRESDQEIESAGIQRTKDYMKKADLIIIVLNNKPNDCPANDYPKNIPTIIVRNKIDRLSEENFSKLQSTNPQHLFISAKMRTNIVQLKSEIKKSIGIGSSLSGGVSITTTRQKNSLLQCNDNLRNILSLLEKQRTPYELISIELRESLDAIGEILGKTTPDDILNNIFNQFCVGK